MKKHEYFALAVYISLLGMILSTLWIFAGWQCTVFDCITWAVVLIIAANEYIIRQKLANEEQILKTFERFLTLVRHRFNAHGMADEAVCDALEECTDKKIRKIMEQFYDVIKSEDIGSEAAKFREKQKNPFIRLFLTLCITVLEYGDKKIDGQSVFLSNIKHLKDEINSEILQIKARRYRFSGTTIVIVLPILSLRLIEDWGMGNIEELASFYLGKQGLLFRIVLLALTCVVYIFINEMKKYSRPQNDNLRVWYINPGKRMNKLINQYMSGHVENVNRIRHLLAECGNMTDYKSFFIIRHALMLIVGILSLYISFLVTEDEYGIVQLMTVVLCSIAAYYFPELLLMYRRRLIRAGRDEEVIQYQSVIMILMHSEQVSTIQLLEEIESFSVYFKRALGECINDYQSGDIEALRRFKESTGCEAMEQLLDNFIMSDDIGIKAAFDGIVPEQSYYREKRKQENMIHMDKKVMLAKMIAFAPMFAAIGGYLIIPFVIESMKKMEGFII